jgi:hypothetical protein
VARDIDQVIDFVRGLDWPEPQKLIVIRRLDKPPTSEELALAKVEAYGERALSEADREQLERCGFTPEKVSELIANSA